MAKKLKQDVTLILLRSIMRFDIEGSDLEPYQRLDYARHALELFRGRAATIGESEPFAHEIFIELCERIVQGREETIGALVACDQADSPRFLPKVPNGTLNAIKQKCAQSDAFVTFQQFEKALASCWERGALAGVAEILSDALGDAQQGKCTYECAMQRIAAGATDATRKSSRRIVRTAQDGANTAASFWAAYTEPGKVLPGFVGPLRDTGLGRPGDLVFLGGWTGTFKTQLCTYLAARAMLAGQNIIYVSTEVSHAEMAARIAIVLHNITQPTRMLPLMPSAHDLPQRIAAAEHMEHMQRSKEWGQCSVMATCSDDTLDAIFSLAEAESRAMHSDNDRHASLLIIDYLGQILPPGTKSGQENEALNRTIAKTKDLALRFLNGRGVLVLSPWQVSRGAYNEAIKEAQGTLKKKGSGVAFYSDATVLSNAHEAERSADRVLGIFNQADLDASKADGMRTELVLSDLKFRRGQRRAPVFVEVLHDYGIFNDLRAVTDPADAAKIAGATYKLESEGV